MTIDDVKTYLRVDEDMTDDDLLIQSLISGAKEYVIQQTGKTKVKTSVDSNNLPVYSDISVGELYNLVVKIMVAHWYENRGVAMAGTLTNITYSAEMLLSHIALSGDYI